MSILRGILGVWFVFISGTASMSLEEPQFCFWGNLNRHEQVIDELSFTDTGKRYCEALPKLSPEKAASCCSVKPGQSVSLVSMGQVIGKGRIEGIHSEYLSGADDRRVVIGTSGISLPEGLVSGGIPFPPRWDQKPYSLFVVGNCDIEEMKPVATMPTAPIDFLTMSKTILSDRIIDKGGYRKFRKQAGMGNGDFSKGFLAETLKEYGKILEFTIELQNGDNIVIQSITTPYGKDQYGFFRVYIPSLDSTFYVKGTLDYFLQINEKTYVVARQNRPGSGMWGYFVFLLHPKKSPEEVHSDTSWST